MSDEPAPTPLTKPLILIGHRGARDVAPDNSIPGIELAIETGVTAVEIDLRLTADGEVVLCHDTWMPRALFDPAAGKDERLYFNKLLLADVRKLRYDASVGERRYRSLVVPTFDEVMTRFLSKVNFDLDIKDTPIEKVVELVRRYKAWNRCVIMTRDIENIRRMKELEPRLNFEWAQNLLGRHEVDGRYVTLPREQCLEEFRKALEEYSKLGGGLLCVKVLDPEIVALCHRYRVLVRPSVQMVKKGTGERWLKRGVDALLSDSPSNARKGIESALGADYLPNGREDIAAVIKWARRKR